MQIDIAKAKNIKIFFEKKKDIFRKANGAALRKQTCGSGYFS